MNKINTIVMVLVLSIASTPLAARSGAGAINMVFNTSVRAAGMGDAGVAVTEGFDTNHWANPALLAFRPGVHYTKFESQLALGFAEDIWLNNEEVTLGYGGVTLLWARGPLDGNFLAMGEQMAIDEYGQVIGTFETYNKSESWGVGVDGVQVLERLMDRSPGDLSRYLSLAGGVTFHDFEGKLGHEDAVPGWDGTGGATARSEGFVIRVTPLDATRGRGLLDNGLLGLRVTGSYGKSILNKTNDFIVYIEVDQGDPMPRLYLDGWAANAQITLADDLRLELNDKGLGFLGDMINPLVSVTRTEQTNDPGYFWNQDLGAYEYGHDTSGDYEEKGRGLEIGLLNMFFWREGHTTALYGDIDADTEGGGFRIQAGRLGGFRKDWADVPQASGLPDVRRESWAVWVDPFAIMETLK